MPEFRTRLEEALEDAEVIKDVESYQLLLEAKSKLREGEDDNLVAARLCDRIAYYLMLHHYKAPKKIIALSQLILKASANHRRLISIPFWLSNLFR